MWERFSPSRMVFRSAAPIPDISNDEEVGLLFSDYSRKEILWYYTFELIKDGIHNMNKTRYRDFHTYTEAHSSYTKK